MTYIYHYHPETHIYLCKEIADENPLEPGVYLVPANATLEPPPTIPITKGYAYTWCLDTNQWITKRIPPPKKGDPETTEHLTEEELIERKWELLRENRNLMLRETDYLFMRDYILTAEQDYKWRMYRQALRDLPKNTTDIDNPPWPLLPTMTTIQ